MTSVSWGWANSLYHLWFPHHPALHMLRRQPGGVGWLFKLLCSVSFLGSPYSMPGLSPIILLFPTWTAASGQQSAGFPCSLATGIIPLTQPGVGFLLKLSCSPSRWLSGKESTSQCRGCGFHPWVRKFPWMEAWQPTPVFLPAKSHGQRDWVGYMGFSQSWTCLC